VLRRGRFVGVALLVVLAVTGCSDDSGDSDDDGGNGDGQVTSIDITIEGDDVTPNGKQIAVPINEPIELHITADRAGELHVHTAPEVEIEFEAGETTESLTIDRPGVVTVELHDSEKIVMELEAS